ncbi:MAG: riboflavin biosynthesis protein RibF [Candidatus Aminicenantes bacterium]|nr:riboflavin biosynthesis protein RibF [Candidatus Aminicenantes bacterium]
MKVFHGLEERPVFPDGTALAIGNFDGLHLGHQEILRFLVDKARERKLVSLVLTFSPHPERVLGGGRTAMIQTLEQRLAGIRASGVEAVLLAGFSKAFADLSVKEFVSRIIVAGLKAKEVIIGENFRFGRGRQGDVDDLSQYGRKLGFSVHPRQAVFRNGQIVSSSRIRSLLQAGNIITANRLLGYPYLLEGRVIRGRGRGRDLGFPTANIRADNEIAPPGVHLTLAQIQGRLYPSLTNSGYRPTFGAGPAQIETYVFDFKGALYRRKIALHFLRKLRKEKRFPGADELARQIRRDVAASRLYFEKNASALEMIRVSP